MKTCKKSNRFDKAIKIFRNGGKGKELTDKELDKVYKQVMKGMRNDLNKPIEDMKSKMLNIFADVGVKYGKEGAVGASYLCLAEVMFYLMFGYDDKHIYSRVKDNVLSLLESIEYREKISKYEDDKSLSSYFG